PILLAILYSRMYDEADGVSYELIYIIIGITFSAVTTSLMMMIMAEEKEKNTLRGLMMSPASFVDVIVGKSLVTTLLTVVTFVISFLIFDASLLLDFSIIFSSLLLFVFFLLLGIGVGLFVKSVGTTTIYTLP